MKLERQLKKIIKQIPKFNRTVVVCGRCGNIYDKTKEQGMLEYDLDTKEVIHYCEHCTKIMDEELEERDMKFKAECPLHKDCCLWCDNCENAEHCKVLKGEDNGR